jgi:hypothetical protein
MSEPESNKTSGRVRVARLLVGVVLISNLSAAIPYLVKPGSYAWAFELEGNPGMAVVMALGILFTMWQVPYVFAAVNPLKHKTSLIEAVLMQSIGLLGETWLQSRIEPAYAVLRGSISRFIAFDACGLVLLMIALRLVSNRNMKSENLE